MVIRVGLVGVADPRHRHFLAALRRRRAGVRVVGASEPDPTVRGEFCQLYGLPGWADHRAMLGAAGPSLVAVAHSGPGSVVIDALTAGADVLVAPPICRSLGELDLITELAAARRLTAAHTWRGSPAARTAHELVASGRLGHPDLVSLLISDRADDDQQRLMITEALDLFGWLTGSVSLTVRPITDDDPEDAAGFGELIMQVAGASAALEIRRRPDLDDRSAIVQIAGEAGAVEWDVRSGLLRSAITGREPVTVSCGPPGMIDDWVLNNLLRKPRPVISTESSLATTRALLSNRCRPGRG